MVSCLSHVLLVALSLTVCSSANSRPNGESGETSKPPRAGTLCQLLSRDVLTAESENLPAVHRLKLSLPTSYRIPECCHGDDGMIHVRVKAPDAPKQTMRVNPYSAHINETDSSFTIVVKVYPGGSPDSPGVSSYLGAVNVGDYVHVPEIRAWDWRRDSKRTAMICFGVGITECLGPAASLLKSGAEVRMVYASRDADQIILGDSIKALLDAYPSRFRVRHCLSQPGASTRLSPRKAALQSHHGSETTGGRVDYKVLTEEFGGKWKGGGLAEHFFMIGTTAMEQQVLGMIGRAQLADFSKIRGHPEFLLMKGPHGHNSNWNALSPNSDEREL